MCIAQGSQRSDAGEAGTGASWSRVKHSTTEPLRSQLPFVIKTLFCLFLSGRFTQVLLYM